MKRILLSIILLIPSILWAQRISGTIKNDETPVPYVTVAIKELQIGTATLDNGDFTISSKKIIDGNYTLIISGVGFETKEVAVTVSGGNSNPVEINLKQSEFYLDEVTISGYRESITSNERKENIISKLPVASRYQIPNVNSFSLETLQQLRIKGLDELTLFAPSFSIEETRGDAFLDIKVRGNNATLLYNGLRLESATRSGSGNMNFNVIESVEFINGSSGIGYGNASIGGAINVNTKQAQLSNLGGGFISASSFGTYSATIDKNILLSDKLGFRMNAAAVTGSKARVHTDYSNFSLAPSFLYQISEKDKLTVDYSFYSDKRTPDQGTLIIDPSKAFEDSNFIMSHTDDFVGFTDDEQLEDVHMGMLNYTHDFSSVWSVSAKYGIYDRWRSRNRLNISNRAAGYQDIDGDDIYDYFNRAVAYQEDDNEVQTGRIDFIGANVKTGRFLHNIQASFDMWDNISRERGYNGGTGTSTREPGAVIDSIDINNPIFINDISELTDDQRTAYSESKDNLNAQNEDHTSIWGVTIQDQIQFNKLRVTLGGRYSKGFTEAEDIEGFTTNDEIVTTSDKEHFSGWNYNFGTFYDITDNITGYASYANTYDESNVSVDRVDVNGVKIPNETTDQYEIGVRSSLFQKRFTANINYYNMVNNDVAIQAIDAEGNTLTSATAYDPINNADSTFYIYGDKETRKGVEVFLQGNVTPNIMILGSYAYFNYSILVTDQSDGSEAEVTQRAAGQPDHSGSIWSTYSFTEGKLKGLTIGTGLLIKGNLPVDRSEDELLVPSYSRWDATVGYKFNERFNLTAKFNNLTSATGFETFRTSIINPIQPFNFDLRLNVYF